MRSPRFVLLLCLFARISDRGGGLLRQLCVLYVHICHRHSNNFNKACASAAVFSSACAYAAALRAVL
jgi:hypothetical protein